MLWDVLFQIYFPDPDMKVLLRFMNWKKGIQCDFCISLVLQDDIDGLVQYCSHSNALAMELM